MHQQRQSINAVLLQREFFSQNCIVAQANCIVAQSPTTAATAATAAATTTAGATARDSVGLLVLQFTVFWSWPISLLHCGPALALHPAAKCGVMPAQQYAASFRMLGRSRHAALFLRARRPHGRCQDTSLRAPTQSPVFIQIWTPFTRCYGKHGVKTPFTRYYEGDWKLVVDQRDAPTGGRVHLLRLRFNCASSLSLCTLRVRQW